MNKTGKRRLLKLAGMLEADAENEKGICFDIGVVGRKMEVRWDDIPRNYKPEISCGTAACAMGLAALSGEFKKNGLSWRKQRRGSGFMIDTTFKGHVTDYDIAAMKLFSISKDEATWLFNPWKYPSDKKVGAVGERLVAKRIRHLVTRGVSQRTLNKIYS